jgi:hypothetical protein
MVSRSVTLSSFIMALSRRKVRAGGGLPVEVFNCPPNLAYFELPAAGREPIETFEQWKTQANGRRRIGVGRLPDDSSARDGLGVILRKDLLRFRDLFDFRLCYG